MRGLEKMASDGADRQTNRQTSGHRDSMTESADSVKITAWNKVVFLGLFNSLLMGLGQDQQQHPDVLTVLEELARGFYFVHWYSFAKIVLPLRTSLFLLMRKVGSMK